MKIFMRIHRTLYETMTTDLRRNHPSAWERVGFLSARCSSAGGDDKLLVLTAYHALPDEQYISDDSVGARINADAIRESMQRVLDTGESAIHVHMHNDEYPIGFSRSDMNGYSGLIPALRRVGPKQPHGAIVLNSNAITGAIWFPGATAPVISKRLSVVGFPMSFLGGLDHGK